MATTILPARPARTRRQTVEALQRTLDELRALLTEALVVPAARVSCDCEECGAKRAVAFDCLVCGHEIPPLVLPCGCQATRALLLGHYEDLASGRRTPAAHETPERVQACHARALEIPDRLCREGDWHRPACGHGLTCCSFCGADAKGRTRLERVDLMDVLDHARSLVGGCYPEIGSGAT